MKQNKPGIWIVELELLSIFELLKHPEKTQAILGT